MQGTTAILRAAAAIEVAADFRDGKTASVKRRCRNIYIIGSLRNLPRSACSSWKISCSSVQI